MKMKKQHDDGLEWLREIRREMAKQCNYDPKKLGELYRRAQKRHVSRIFHEEEITTVKG